MEHPLRTYRAEHALSIDALADMVGVSKSTISRVETGEQAPSVALIRRLVFATGGAVTAEVFVNWGASPEPIEAA